MPLILDENIRLREMLTELREENARLREQYFRAMWYVGFYYHAEGDRKGQTEDEITAGIERIKLAIEDIATLFVAEGESWGKPVLRSIEENS